MYTSIKYLIIIGLFIQVFISCEKEEFNTSVDAKLEFSEDTIMFDTIFTTIGSSTRRFTVKNPYNKRLSISSIYLAGGENSPYRLNIDGYPGIRLDDIELREKDSLYVFVEITVDPNNSNLPLVVKDSIIFSFNNKQQDIDLISFGQDVHLIKTQGRFSVINENSNWINDKPYLVYDSLIVAPNTTLTLEPGVKVYFHKSSGCYISGTVVATGTFESPIIFQGDRLENDYDDIPGQWDGIWLMAGSKDNVFDFCEIKNAIIGIQTDTLANLSKPTLLLSNSRIENMSSTGIYAQGSTIEAFNNLISNCGQYAVALTIGGSYEFYHCTIGNYWGYSTRTTPSLLLNNYYIDLKNHVQIRPINKALFGNCIIYGNKESEIRIDKFDAGSELNFKFDHSLIRVGSDFSTSDPASFENVIVNMNPQFKDPYNGDFELDTLSIAKDFGKLEYSNITVYDYNIVIDMNYDLNMENRTRDSGPDLGAFERIENP